MNKLALIAVSISLGLSAGAASAQPYGRPGSVAVVEYGFGRDFWRGAPDDVHQRLGWLDMRLRAGLREGSITRSEFNRVGRMMHQTRRVETRLMRRDRGQLSQRDREYMQTRLDNMSMQIRWARTNGVDRPMDRHGSNRR